ncbi:MAG: IPT/TIG domain-containing protein, partial [Proteobacteria bacterium]|nr:IPT/TIG domain-containing protein [Pseudomonadota bacterium]
ETWTSSTQMGFELPVGLEEGEHTVSVTNPDGSSATTELSFVVVGPPTLESVDPDLVCSGTEFTVTGGLFVDGATQVWVGDVEASVVSVADDAVVAEAPNGLAPGLHDVTVGLAGACETTLTDALEVAQEPIVFFVDPPSVFRGTFTQVSVWVTGIEGSVTDVTIVDASGNETSVPFSWTAIRSSRIFATIPDGLSEGSYDVRVTDESGCSAVLEDAFEVEGDLTVDLLAIDPPFGWTSGPTAVTLRAGNPGFVDPPRVYLSPETPSDVNLATELVGVTFNSPSRATAVVPSGLSAGRYDVLVVNPDGGMGRLPLAFTITADPPPVITAVSPVSTDNQNDLAATILGENFRNPVVEIECRDLASGTLGARVEGAIGSATADQIDVTLPTSTLTPSVCLVWVTNSDGTWANYASVSVALPSRNLSAWNTGPDLLVPRRAPAAAAGRATTTARFLYALGGDDGAGTVLDSVEASPVDVFGDLAGFRMLPMPLPRPLTSATAATLDRFLYIVGGHDGTGTVDTGWRAQILDPLDAPQITDLGIEVGQGLVAGRWTYRVSAVYATADNDNPGGESLPSDPFTVRLPDIPGGVAPTLTWTADTRAVAYRVYRSPVADAASGTEALLAEVTSASYTDVGDAPGTLTPLRLGDLGHWEPLPVMAAGRQAPFAAIGVDPGDAGFATLVVAGGLDDTSARSDIQWLQITRNGPGDHEVQASFSTATAALTTPRYEGATFIADSDLHSVVPTGDTWLYFGGGRTTAAAIDGTFDAVRIAAGGDVTGFVEVDTLPNSRAGYAFASAGDTLYVFGGNGGSPSVSGDSAGICATGLPGCNAGPPDPPDLQNWNGLANEANLLVPRYLAGSTQESSVIFVVGGTTDTAQASTAVEWNNY